MRAIIIALVVGLIAGIALGLAAYHHLVRWEPMQETTATFRPGKLQADGSADLTRIPTAPADAGPPPHILPAKAKETARARIVVKPKPKPNVPAGKHDAPAGDHISQPGNIVEPTCSCDPVVIDVSQYLGPDGAGVIASSPDGEVDVQQSTYTPLLEERPAPRHFLAITAEPGRDAYTGMVGRRWGRVGLGIGASRDDDGRVRAVVGGEWNW